MNVHDLILQTKDIPDLLTIEATVITGFEFLAQDECREKCKPSSIVKTKGRIFFNIPAADFNKVLTLRSVDNVFLVTETIKQISFDENKDNDLNIVKSFVELVAWETSLNKWQNISGFEGIIYPLKNKIVKSLEEESLEGVNENRPCENVINDSGGENISVNSTAGDILTENKKAVDNESVLNTCTTLNQVTSDSVGDSLKTDSVNLDNNACSSSSIHNIACDLVSKVSIDNNGASFDQRDIQSKDKHHCEQPIFVTPESNKQVELSQPAAVEEVNNLISDKEFVGNDSKHPDPEECHPTNEKRQYRGRGARNNNAKPRAKRLQRIKNSGILKFRATCYRVGGKHSFSSMEAACEFGGTLQDKFGWTVDLTQFDLNVILNIEKNQAYICIALTDESLHRRNITHFNNTTLRATMCYNLFRLAEPMTGEIVIDPLCGGGSIPIEGSLSFPNTYHICGDYNEKAVERTRANINHICKTKTELKVGAVKWNAKFLPLRCQSVDVLVSDLPFGKRSGSKQDNQRLYSSILYELAKVIRTGTGRACLLTYDRTALTRALRAQNNFWREIRQFGVNQGGLFSTVFLLLRRATPVPEGTNIADVDIALVEDNSDIASDKSTVSRTSELKENLSGNNVSREYDSSRDNEKQLPSAVENNIKQVENISDNTVLNKEKFEDKTTLNVNSETSENKNTDDSLVRSVQVAQPDS